MCCSNSFTEETGSLEGSEPLSAADDKLELVSECWVEPVDGTVVNCTAELSHFTDCIYSHIQDVVCHGVNSILYMLPLNFWIFWLFLKPRFLSLYYFRFLFSCLYEFTAS